MTILWSSFIVISTFVFETENHWPYMDAHGTTSVEIAICLCQSVRAVHSQSMSLH